MSELNLCLREIPTSQNQHVTNKPFLCKNKFEKLMIEAIDQELSSMGDSCRDSIYFGLKSVFGIRKQEIPYKIEEFASALEKIFGAGAKLLEIKIIEAVSQKVNHFKYSPKHGDIIFTEYLIALRSFL